MASFPKKLIEVALPLSEINAASSREKSIRHGHPSTLHLWWARRPLAAARAVIFAQMVDDPSEYVDVLLSDPPKKRAASAEMKRRKAKDPNSSSSDQQLLEEIAAELERERLFDLIKELVKWENTNNAKLLEQANAEIWQSWRRTCAQNADHPRASELFDRNKLPAFHDPFAGGGALPLEAQRLGLEAHASDLNPVAVLINKAMIEIPPMFAGQPPVNPMSQSEQMIVPRTWSGAQGLAEDVRYYGEWMRDEAHRRIGHLYPKIEITQEMAQDRPDLEPYVGQKLTIIAWLWARTVKSPNPAYRDIDVPLAYTFMLSTKKGKETYVEPVINGKKYSFKVKVGVPPDLERAKRGTKLSRGANFECLLSGVPIDGDYIKQEGQAHRMGSRMMAIVAEGHRGRVYLMPEGRSENSAQETNPNWKPENSLVGKCRDQLPLYGMETFADLFTSRQLTALTTFSDLIGEAIVRIKHDAIASGREDDGQPLRDNATGATAYAQAVGLYLAFVVDRLAMTGNNLVRWNPVGQKAQHCFGRQALPMVWGYAEPNFFATSTGSIHAAIKCTVDPLNELPSPLVRGNCKQEDASANHYSQPQIISTDPPYYDNIGYADLSDFFYVWLRHSLYRVFPELFETLAVPKDDELVATPYRHGSKHAAEKFFLDGMKLALGQIINKAYTGFPVTIYYAFKQSETRTKRDVISTGWETFLDAAIQSGLTITGTWPVRTELSKRLIAADSNALASSIVLVCRPRLTKAPLATRREFLAALHSKLPNAIHLLQTGNTAPVDLAQAAIGPGMKIYSRYAKVLDATGQPVSVRDALALINQVLDEVMAEQEGDFDEDSRWALSWFSQYGFSEGEYGPAETLSKAKNTSVDGMVRAGILSSKKGKVRLLMPEELPDDWDPITDDRLTVWETVHHLIRILNKEGETGAGHLAAKLGNIAPKARELCYKLYLDCDRNKRSQDALAYNQLVQSWPEIMRIARSEQGMQVEIF
ncbi:MAG: DUF1156 domain-containing protein [Bacteroidota bacterium]|nr:DUF1156 domain-containing protein [Bacteroidota bacterium]